ncbi:trigger factor [Patescibacteria group bacterium]|nr:trigger factor [Patescibacteria group bacterium]
MNVKKTEKSPTEVELEIEVSPEEMEKYLDMAAKTLSNKVKIEGFRAGKVPRNILEMKVGKAALFDEAVNIALPKTYTQAVIDNNLEPVGDPEISPKKAAVGNPFIYVATVTILPSFTLPDLSKISVKKKEKVTVSKKDVEKTLHTLAEQRAKTTAVDRASKKGDEIVIDFKIYRDKVQIENGDYKDFPATIGDSKFIPGFEDKVVGLKKGDKKEFDLTFPKDYYEKILAGKKATFKVTVKDVKEKELPTIDDAFAQSLGGLKDLKDLEKKIEENLTVEAEKKENERQEKEILEKVNEKITVDLPKKLVAGEQEQLLREFQQMVERQGGAFDEYLESIKKTKEQLLKEFTKSAEERVKTALMLREVAKKEKLTITEEEVEKEREIHKMQYQQNPELKERVESDDYTAYLRNMLMNKKVVGFLKEKVVK